MSNTRDWKPTEHWQGLVYGRSGVGKTWGALTFPRPVMMDFDKGIATHSNPDFIKLYGKIEVEYEQFTERSVDQHKIPTAHNAFDDACRYFDRWMTPAKRGEFDTWIIDSGTSLSEFAQFKAVILMGKMRLSKTHQEALHEGLIVPKIQDYASERSLVEQFVDMLRDSNKNLVFICHEKELINDAGTVTAIVPLLTGKSVENVPLKFDEVYNLKVQKKGLEMVRTLQTKPDGIRVVKSRYGLPDETPWDWKSVTSAMVQARTPIQGAAK